MDVAFTASQNLGTVRTPFFRALLGAALPLSLLASCGDADVVGAHIDLEADGSGHATIRSLLPSGSPGPAEAAIDGIDFQGRAQLHSSEGPFGDITEVDLGGIRFERQGANGLRVRLPVGPEAPWARALAPSPDAQGATARTFDPEASTRALGATVRFVLEAPDLVISNGCYPRARGVEWDKERDKASLWIPVRTALRAGDPLVWDITWQ